MSTIQTAKNRINKALSSFNTTYHVSIPLGEIFTVVYEFAGQVIDVDGTPWSGFLCGDSGQTTFDIEGVKFHLFLSWYTMPSGRYEVIAYVS